jgi:hypothetical protein
MSWVYNRPATVTNRDSITVISVEPVGGYCWDTRHGNIVAGVKMMVGAAIGKTLDDSIEGTLAL